MLISHYFILPAVVHKTCDYWSKTWKISAGCISIAGNRGRSRWCLLFEFLKQKMNWRLLIKREELYFITDIWVGRDAGWRFTTFCDSSLSIFWTIRRVFESKSNSNPLSSLSEKTNRRMFSRLNSGGVHNLNEIMRREKSIFLFLYWNRSSHGRSKEIELDTVDEWETALGPEIIGLVDVVVPLRLDAEFWFSPPKRRLRIEVILRKKSTLFYPKLVQKWDSSIMKRNVIIFDATWFSTSLTNSNDDSRKMN